MTIVGSITTATIIILVLILINIIINATLFIVEYPIQGLEGRFLAEANLLFMVLFIILGLFFLIIIVFSRQQGR
jgi:hypothetical protein